MLEAPNLSSLPWLTHGFGFRDSQYPSPITTVKQIHSDRVIEVSGRSGDRIAEADAMITGEKGRKIGIRTADCVPILIADKRTHSVAAIHAGWRGTAGNISGAAVRELIARFGVRAEDLAAAIGPSIGACCYEVGEEVANQFAQWVPEDEHLKKRSHLDLSALNELQLREIGVRDIWKAGECTRCLGHRYYSFRREKEAAGRMISYIGEI